MLHPRSDLATKLLDWFDHNRRQFPWRAGPGTSPNPYHVLLSEFMLQQTTVATVTGYFQKFVEKWPTIQALAGADLDDVRAAWAGLGYYSRASNLHRAVSEIVQNWDGVIPQEIDLLQKLPGIGPYTAAAIASIAYDQKALVVDGNVERWISRLFLILEPLPKSKNLIRDALAQILPDHRYGDFAQAMMDFASTVCVARTPRCFNCPFFEDCQGFKAGIAASLPRKLPKKPKKLLFGNCYVIVDPSGKRIWLRQRQEQGLLAGLMELPGSEWLETQEAVHNLSPPVTSNWRQVSGTVRHIFTHIDLSLTVYTTQWQNSAPPLNDGSWTNLAEIESLALPTLMKKVLGLWQSNRD